MGYLEAACVQSDWTGTVCRETWYGQHAPWRRIISFVLFSSWALTITWIVQLFFDPILLDGNRVVPILQFMEDVEFQDMKNSHEDCLISLCEEVGRVVPVHCVVNDDGKSAHVEFEEDEDQPRFIPIPQACHEATEKTFGYRFLDRDDEIPKPAVKLLSLLPPSEKGQNSTSAETALLTLLPECTIVVNTAPALSQEDMNAIRDQLDMDTFSTLFDEATFQGGPDLSLAMPLMDLVGHQVVPGHQETYILKRVFCPEELPQEIQTNILPVLAAAYDFFLEYRFEIMAVAIYCYHVWVNILSVIWLMLRLLLPTYVLQRCLTWPSSPASSEPESSKAITYWDIWRGLLLLCVISNQASLCLLSSGLLALGACFYKNTSAAMEWAFLGMLTWGAPDLFPYMDSILGDSLVRLDGLNLAGWAVHLLIVGDGWWKLVRIYVVTRAYQSLQKNLRPNNGLQDTRFNMTMEERQQQLGGRLPNEEEHAKVD